MEKSSHQLVKNTTSCLRYQLQLYEEDIGLTAELKQCDVVCYTPLSPSHSAVTVSLSNERHVPR